jgi:hypothetical protein
VLLEPTTHFLTDVPRGVIPDEKQHALALTLHLLAEPVEKSRRHVTDGPPIDKAQPHRLAAGFQHALATQSFGIGIVFADLQFLQAQRLSRFTPAMHLRLSHATPPHFIDIPYSPTAPPGQGNQGVAPFFSWRSRDRGRVGGQRVAIAGTFSTSPLQTDRTAFTVISFPASSGFSCP